MLIGDYLKMWLYMSVVLRLCDGGSCYRLQGASHLVNRKKCVLVRCGDINMRNISSFGCAGFGI